MSNLEQTDDAIEHLQICYRFWHQFTPLSFFLKGEIHRANVTVFSVPGLCMDSLRAYNYKKRRKVSPHTRQILIKSIQKKIFPTKVLRILLRLFFFCTVWICVSDENTSRLCCCLTQLNYHLNTAVPIKVHYIRTITDCSNTHNCSIIFIFATIRKEISPGCKQEPQCNNPFIKPLFQLKHIHARCPILHQILFKIFDNSLYIFIQERS